MTGELKEVYILVPRRDTQVIISPLISTEGM